MFKAEPLKRKANYYKIKEGSFRVTSHADDPAAIRRDYRNPKTGEDGVAYERAYKALYGHITDVFFSENALPDGTVLRSVNISLGEDEDGVAQVITIPTNSRYTSDFLKKLPAVNLDEEVRLMPYDFEPKEGPRQVGISICQLDPTSGEYTFKVYDYFVKVEEVNGEKKYTNLHGFPEPTEEDKEDWPFYFTKVNKFLIKYAQEHVLPKFGARQKPQNDRMEEAMDEILGGETKDNINPDDVPF